jgi:hypothetical protein
VNDLEPQRTSSKQLSVNYIIGSNALLLTKLTTSDSAK